MNSFGSFTPKKKRKSLKGNFDKIDLDLSRVNQREVKYTISPRKIRESNSNKIFSKNKNIGLYYNNKQKSNLLLSTIKSSSSFNPVRNINSFDNDNLYLKTSLNELFQNKGKKLLKKKNLKLDNNYKQQKTIANNISIKFPKLNNIEKNLKNTIFIMRKEIEKKNRISNMTNCITPKIFRNKLYSSPNIKIYFKRKKRKSKILKNPSFIKESNIFEYFSEKKFNIKRNKSYDYTEPQKKKLIKKLKRHLIIKSKGKLTLNDNNIKDDIDNSEKSISFILLPNSKFIFVFDLFLIIADIYSSIIIPLTVAKNRNIIIKETFFNKIIHYSIDFIFFLDFIISLFRGYYDKEMEIVKDNKNIFFNYLENEFILDFFQAIPIYIILRTFMKTSGKVYLDYSEKQSYFIIFLLFIKPFKIFKIMKKKKNKALDDFYSYLSESYYIEKLFKFLIDFLIFFLFVHLFICFHIYLSFQNYPNWIININIMNKTFLTKYITSFYFMITTMTTVGYGDIVSISFIERLYNIILLVIGTTLYTYLISKMGNYLRDQSHEQIKLSNDLNILEKIRISNPQMPFKLYSKIKSHLLNIFKKRKKTGISLLINGVPDAIKNDLLFKIYSKVINGFVIFKNIKNSNFIIQMLTNFIPIISKKEEIIILEGEDIQNIIFIKDGRLSLEIAINLNDVHKSIQKYLENNFNGISRKEELLHHNFMNRVNSIMNMSEKNYDDLKSKIDNILLDNQKISLINNSRIDNNGISVDLGRIDFSRNEIEQNQNEDLHIIKILDIWKNEHFGDVHMFLEKPSPFTIKVKSRIAELLLLRKNDAIIMSKNFPNIWRRIENKSYHNLVSIKKLTFKTLKRYYNTHFYPKINKENNFVLNSDTKNFFSGISSDNRVSFIINKMSRNISNINSNNNINENINNSKNKSNNTINSLEKIKTNSNKLKNTINTNNLFDCYNSPKRKISIDTINNNHNISISSLKSNSTHNLNFNIQLETYLKEFEKKKEINSKANIVKNNDKKNIRTQNLNIKSSNLNKNSTLNTEMNKIINKKTNEDLSFKDEKQGNKLVMSNSKKFLQLNDCQNNITFKSTGLIKSLSSKRKSTKSINTESISKNGTIKCYCKNEETTINNPCEMDIFTLDDVNKQFSKKIKKKLKKRKKIQKLKELLKLQRFKINKNLLELYLNMLHKHNLNENSKNKPDKFNDSLTSSNNKIASEILESTSSEGGSSTLIKNKINFDINLLKIISIDSFEIKSSYKNINSLTKGEMIRNIKYKKFVENLIKKHSNKNISNEDIYKTILSLMESKKEKNKIINFKSYNKKDKKNNNSYSLKNSRISLASKKKNRNNIYDQEKQFYKNKINLISVNESIKDIKSSKTPSKFFEKESKNKKSKNSDAKKNKNKLLKLENNNMEYKIEFIKDNNIEGKKLFKTKNSDKRNNKQIVNDINNDINDKMLTSTLNALNEYEYNKEYKLSCLNKENIRSFNTIIQLKNSEEEKSKICIII